MLLMTKLYCSLVLRPCWRKKSGLVFTVGACAKIPYSKWDIYTIVNKPLTFSIALTSASQPISPVQEMLATNRAQRKQ